VWQRAYGESIATLFVLLVISLGGGSLRQERALGTLGFTLALPVSRTRHVVARTLTGVAEVVALLLLVALEIVALAQTGGVGFRPGWALGVALLWAALGSLLLCLALLVASVVESELVAWLGTFVAVMGYEAVVNLTPLRAYPALDLYRFLAGASVHGGVLPWASLATLGVGCVLLVGAAVLHLGRREL
jgi:ABC-type transport system involved in multi-copper enzyme maturation permease subunit